MVNTVSGAICGQEARGILSFKGIPYARPPEGRLRFQPPLPPRPWKEVRPATTAGPVPVQAAIPVLRFLNAGGARQAEDCLYLNVQTPGLEGKKRPVFVWIHGGGFLIGAGSTRLYDGSSLAERGDMVVVTINYRLGALGYVHLDRVTGRGFEQASNLGVRDQIAALEWVRENIENFGGDPDNVTLCGQSAGAMSIAALLGAPSARRLFQRAILQSGAAHHVLDRDRADDVAERFLEALGNPKQTRQSLSEIPIGKILRAQGSVNRELMNLADLMVMLPCVDGELITEQPLDAVEKGSTRGIDLLIGTTLDEWKLFSSLEAAVSRFDEDGLVRRFAELLPDVSSSAPSAEEAARDYREAVRMRGGRTTPFEVWTSFQSTRVFHHPASELANRHAAAGGSVYSYLFSWHPSGLANSVGSCHAMDLPFIFGLANHPTTRVLSGLTNAARRLSTRMQNAWIRFARSGNPAHERLPEWDTYDSDTRATMVFDRECTIVDGPLDGERNLVASWS